MTTKNFLSSLMPALCKVHLCLIFDLMHLLGFPQCAGISSPNQNTCQTVKSVHK